MKCTVCSKNNQLVAITTYKRKWNLCNECGCAFSQEKKRYPLSFLPHQNLKKQKFASEDNIYDYFVSDAHKEVSLSDFNDFINNFSPFLQNAEDKNFYSIKALNKIKKYFAIEKFPIFRLRDRHLYYLVYQFSE